MWLPESGIVITATIRERQQQLSVDVPAFEWLTYQYGTSALDIRILDRVSAEIALRAYVIIYMISARIKWAM